MPSTKPFFECSCENKNEVETLNVQGWRKEGWGQFAISCGSHEPLHSNVVHDEQNQWWVLCNKSNKSPRNFCLPRYECQADTIDFIWGHFSEKSFSRKSSFGVGINQMPDNRLAHNSTLSHAEPKVNLYLSKSFVGTQRCLLSITRKGNEGMKNNLGCSYFSGEPWDDAAGEKEWEMENGNRARTFLSPFRQ